MHPRVEARRKTVGIARQIRSLEQERDTLLQDLRQVHDALLRIRGDYMNVPSMTALASSADRLLATIGEIGVHGDEDHVKTCGALFESARAFIESTRRTLHAARSIQPE